MRRNILIAQTLAAPPISATVLLIAGAREASDFALPPNVDCLTLPSLRKTAAGHYESRALPLPLMEIIDFRAQTIAAAMNSFRPDVFIVDKEPRGACSELQPTLDRLRDGGRTRCVLGLRDVLDDPGTVRREWQAAGNEDAVQSYYHSVWVYGDPNVYDLGREYGLAPKVRQKLSYAGYLDPCQRLSLPLANFQRANETTLPARPFALCMVGGGQDGAQLAAAFAAAEFPPELAGIVLTGPFMPAGDRRVLKARAEANSNLRVLEFVAEPCRLLRKADRVVAMGGYNTVSEILAFQKPALVVPRVVPRQEQLIRAERLSHLGLVDLLHPEHLNPAAVSRWLSRQFAARAQPRKLVDLNGTKRLPTLLRQVLSDQPDMSIPSQSVSAPLESQYVAS